MKIRLPYGETSLPVTLDDRWDVTVIEPVFTPGLADPRAAVQAALRQPIRSRPLAAAVPPGAKPSPDPRQGSEASDPRQGSEASDPRQGSEASGCRSARVGIIFNDITRATPTALLVQAILDELRGVPDSDITLFNATGTHRPNTDVELRSILGDTLCNRFRIVQNEARNPATQTYFGETQRGHPVWINTDLAACDVRILTGFIEPHFFAGFSGGGKAIMPGMAGMRTVLANHGAAMIADARSTWGITAGNPIAEEISEVARRVGADFLVNVVMNKNKQITGVFAGSLEEAHHQGCIYARQTAMARVEAPYDIVLTTNSGYPLDQNLYQAVKGISAAAQIVKPGGAILIAAECRDGIPDYGEYGAMLNDAGSPEQVLAQVLAPGYSRPDQWQAQIQAQIQRRSQVYVYSHCLTRQQIEAALFKPADSVETMLKYLAQHYGPHARIAVLPEGPQTIPYISAS